MWYDLLFTLACIHVVFSCRPLGQREETGRKIKDQTDPGNEVVDIFIYMIKICAYA